MYGIDLTGIQQWLTTQTEGIAEKVFIDKIPKALSEDLRSYIYIIMGNRVMDYGAFKRVNVIISAVAKDRQPGYANKTEINRMVNEVMGLFPMVTEQWSLISPTVMPSRSITGFSYASITAQLTIK